jgi:hypothetical protein
MHTTEPTNYTDIRESLALVLEAEVPEAKDTVLQTLDDAVANNTDQLHFPGNNHAKQPYSAVIAHEGGSTLETRLVAHAHDDQMLIAEYEDHATARFASGFVKQITSHP